MRKGLQVDTSGLEFNLALVGESHFQENIRQVTEDGRWRIFGAMLVPEPTNPYDINAIRVDAQGADGEWRTVGYLQKDVAKSLRPSMEALPEDLDGFVCQGTYRGGASLMYGIWLNLPVS